MQLSELFMKINAHNDVSIADNVTSLTLVIEDETESPTVYTLADFEDNPA